MKQTNNISKKEVLFMEKKITKRKVINAMLNEEVVKANEVYVNYLNHEIELLDKKSASHKPTKNQEANVVIKNAIADVLANTESGMSATDIAKAVDISVQKATALLKQMVEIDKTANKVVDKRKALFTVA